MAEPEWESVSSVDPEGLTPIEVEKRLLELTDTLREALVDWKTRYKAYRDTEREYDQAFARAKLASQEATNDKKYDAELRTAAEREAKDDADVLFKYAEQRLRSIHNVISAWQTVGKSVQQAYQNAGRF
ncbi:hypothetical protein A5747_13675 [Mycobacterium sp. IS-836]|uniref:hypothetical protein n=1 Tax=Mycobacterium sp. IS-836 TaxID=1834160 RepID=UPI00096D108E|nr:hypothetical protein [Mycobacterium sp. IS-836]OMC55433.1 hypothetical protein A5747_13675 [Mycobacterium sp. IS-836]